MKQFSFQNMKRGMVAAVLTLLCVFASAQDVRMATLQHGDEVQVFTGTPAFKNAVAAAQSGDLITLTAGNFDDVGTINKVLTIQGAGYRNTTVRFNINLPEGEEGFYVEGVNFNTQVKVTGYAKNMTFKRCRFASSSSYNNHTTSLAFGTNAENIQIQQCRLNYFYGFSNNKVSILNSAISFLYGDQGNFVLANHCVIGKLGAWPVVYNSAVGNHHKDPDATPLYYSIFGTSTGSRKVECWQVGYTNNYYSSYDYNRDWYNHPFTIASYITNDSIWDMQLTLTDEAREKYIGDDGTEVGLYGGELGFTETPSNPQIVEHEVPSRVDDNGLLHVRFKVEAQK